MWVGRRRRRSLILNCKPGSTCGTWWHSLRMWSCFESHLSLRLANGSLSLLRFPVGLRQLVQACSNPQPSLACPDMSKPHNRTQRLITAVLAVTTYGRDSVVSAPCFVSQHLAPSTPLAASKVLAACFHRFLASPAPMLLRKMSS